jgi:hypothetical protein
MRRIRQRLPALSPTRSTAARARRDDGARVRAAPPALPLTSARLLHLQHTVGNRAVRRMLAGQRSANVIQRAWRRVPRRNFGATGIGGLENADRVYADIQATPRKVLAVMPNGGARLFYYQWGAWVEQFGVGDDVLDPLRQQIAQAAPVVQLPPGVRTHIFNGEPAGNRHAGIHTELEITPQEVLARTAADGKGIYAANVQLQGNQQAKTSLMFPANWDEHDIAEAIKYAVDHIQHGHINGLRFGPSGPGGNAFNIGLRFGDVNNIWATLQTAFPIEYNGNHPTAAAVDDLF